MKVVIRTDSSYEIGSGHVMRCLTLAEALREKENDVSFICRDLPGNLNVLLGNKGFKVYQLPYVKEQGSDIIKITNHSHWLGATWQTDAQETVSILSGEEQVIDWMIIDHYSLERNWEKKVQTYVKRIMVIDDLADRPHDCDLLLDQNYYKNMETRYDQLIPAHCIALLGPRYVLLRPEFITARQNLKIRDGIVKRILVFLGGSDPTNETKKVLNAILQLNQPHIQVDIVVGQSNPHNKQIRELCKLAPSFTLHTQVNNMAELMANADLAIGAGGSTTWERCFLGLPTITLIVAENQAETTGAVAEFGALLNLGWSRNVSAEKIIIEIKKLINNPILLRQMSKIAMQLMGAEKFVRNNCIMSYMEEPDV